MERNLCCSFCGRSEHEVDKLVAGPAVYICDACVGLAHDLIGRSDRPPAAGAARRGIGTRLRRTLSGLRDRLRRSPRAVLAT